MALRAVPSRCASWFVVAGLAVLHASLLAWCAGRTSPVLQEPAHLASGLSHLELDHYALYRVNPPLVRSVAALPLRWAEVNTDWTRLSLDPLRRTEFDVGQDFLRANADKLEDLFFWSRLAVLPLSLVGLIVCYLWGSELFGRSSGMLAALLWACSPTVLGHASLITPDAHAAALGVAAMYGFSRWIRRPTFSAGLVVGSVLGLALLAKTTLLLLCPALAAIWLVRIAIPRYRQMAFAELPQLAALMAMSIAVLNIGYGLEGTGKHLGDYCFQSELLGGAPPDGACGNRFANTIVARLPVPLPADYVLGIDTQRVDFEQQRRSYLRGQWQVGGWGYYYLYASLVKTPLGTLLLGGLSLVAAATSRKFRGSLLDEATLLIPPLLIYAVVSSQTGLTIHPRYVLPALPMIFVWISRVARTDCRQPAAWNAAVLSGASMLIASSLWCCPHPLSYIHELAGGPRAGHRHLLDSGYAWGQDLFHLKRWAAAQKLTEPLFILPFGYVNPADVGMQYQTPVDRTRATTLTDGGDGELPPGWYAVDVNYLMGSDEPAPQPIGARLTIGPWVDVLEKLRRQRPVARCGYSFWIYRIGKRGELPTEESARFQPRFGYRESNSHASIARESYIASKRITPVAELSSDTSHPGPPPDDRGQGDSFSVNRERSQTSTTLIAGARALDPEAWQRLSDDYSSLVYRWCRRAGLTEEDAADLTQEVLTAAWRHIDSFRRDRPGDRLRKWIRAITTNRIRDYWRQRGREATVGGGTSWLQKVHQVAAEDDPRTRSSFAMPRAESADPRLAAIEKVRTIVSDRDWTIFERTVIDELSADEVASELGVSRNVVYLVRSRLLRYVRQAFDGNDLLGNG